MKRIFVQNREWRQMIHLSAFDFDIIFYVTKLEKKRKHKS